MFLDLSELTGVLDNDSHLFSFIIQFFVQFENVLLIAIDTLILESTHWSKKLQKIGSMRTVIHLNQLHEMNQQVVILEIMMRMMFVFVEGDIGFISLILQLTVVPTLSSVVGFLFIWILIFKVSYVEFNCQIFTEFIEQFHIIFYQRDETVDGLRDVSDMCRNMSRQIKRVHFIISIVLANTRYKLENSHAYIYFVGYESHHLSLRQTWSLGTHLLLFYHFVFELIGLLSNSQSRNQFLGTSLTNSLHIWLSPTKSLLPQEYFFGTKTIIQDPHQNVNVILFPQ